MLINTKYPNASNSHWHHSRGPTNSKPHGPTALSTWDLVLRNGQQKTALGRNHPGGNLVDGGRSNGHDLIDLLVGDDERWSEQKTVVHRRT